LFAHRNRIVAQTLSAFALSALAIGCFAEHRLARISASIGAIAGGDRYTSLPELIVLDRLPTLGAGGGGRRHFFLVAPR
jgi:hypothetical protein